MQQPCLGIQQNSRKKNSFLPVISFNCKRRLIHFIQNVLRGVFSDKQYLQKNSLANRQSLLLFHKTNSGLNMLVKMKNKLNVDPKMISTTDIARTDKGAHRKYCVYTNSKLF